MGVNKLKNILAIIVNVIIALSLIAFDSSCSSCNHRHNGSRGGRSSGYHHERNRGNSSGGGCSRGGRSVIVYQPNYFSQRVEVQQGVSLQETLYLIDPKAKIEEQKYNVGGTKLIAEMSADVAGINYSRNECSNVSINILSLNELKLHISNNNASVYSRIINNQVSVQYSRVGFLEGDDILSVIENFITTMLTGTMVVHLKMANTTNKTVSCEILQGQMLETVKEGAQNLVVAESYRFTMRAYEATEVDVHVYCAAHYRGDPSGYSIRFTQYFLNASSEVYQSQLSVWDYIESR